MMALYLSTPKRVKMSLSQLHRTMSATYFSSALADLLGRTGGSLDEKFAANIICEQTRMVQCKFTTVGSVRK